ncbi:hypothetical protein GCM10025866_10570 [Naasia aerilata]|uniref:Non-reducing end beta-L-arabinofuranosidase-like GH127 C-terminal domain-containing protein n=1 Tax=Naasia aerilata TaxID=1162966 RepID=A0ABM8GAA8_9MICO|nr:hypothetical protein GCM10025866_10570 [Naasia aerilata]
MAAMQAEDPDEAWPYGPPAAVAQVTPTRLRMIPYHRWAERGPSEMRVWLPLLDEQDGLRFPADNSSDSSRKGVGAE